MFPFCHCEERSDEAIQPAGSPRLVLRLAMTIESVIHSGWRERARRRPSSGRADFREYCRDCRCAMRRGPDWSRGSRAGR